MTSAQLIVLGLLVAAFVSGWVARGSSGHAALPGASASGDDTGEATVVDAPSPGAQAVPDAGALVDDAVADLTAAIDAWMDGTGAPDALARLEATGVRVREASVDTGDPVLAEVAATLADAERELAPVRAGAPLTATSSRSLERIEERLAEAARDARRA